MPVLPAFAGFPRALALGGALGQQLDRLLEGQLRGVMALAQAGVVAPMPDVGPEAALVQGHRLAVLGVAADLPQLLRRAALPAAGLGEQRHRAVMPIVSTSSSGPTGMKRSFLM